MIILLQVPPVQDFVTGKAEDFLSKKLNTEVRIGRIEIGFPKTLHLEEIYLEEPDGDTLVYAKSIRVNTDFLGLLDNELIISRMELEGITGRVYRTMPDSAFNFDFIMQAFAPPDTAAPVPVDTTAAPFTFKIMNLSLSQIDIIYHDEVAKMELDAIVGSAEVNMDEFDLETMTFNIDKASIADTRGSFVITGLPGESTDTTATPPVNVDIGEIKVTNTDFRFDDRWNGQLANLHIGKFEFEGEEIDLNNQLLDIHRITLLQSRVQYVIRQGIDTTKVEAVKDSVLAYDFTRSFTMGWKVRLDRIEFAENYISMQDSTADPVEGTFDPAHLNISDLTLRAQDIEASGKIANIDITEFHFKEASGLGIQEMHAELHVDSTSAQMENFLVRSMNSTLQGSVTLDYPNLKALTEEINSLEVDASLNGTVLALQDLLYFQPSLASTIPLKQPRSTVIRVDGGVSGSVDDLLIQNLRVSTFEETRLVASGSIKGLPNAANLSFDMKVKEMHTTRADLRRNISDSLIPTNISLPSEINLTASAKGKGMDIKAEAELESSYGNLSAFLTMQPEPGPTQASYVADVNLQDFELGKLMQDTTQFDIVALNFRINGQGLKPEVMEADLNGVVETFDFSGYRYNAIELKGHASANSFSGAVSIDDENLKFDFDGTLDLDSVSPRYKFTLDLEGADFQKLNLATNDFKLKAKIVADLRGQDLNSINGTLAISDVYVISGVREYPVDSLAFVSIQGKDTADISFKSPVLDANISGNINLGDIATTFNEHFERYFTTGTIAVREDLPLQRFRFDIKVKGGDLLTNVLVPELKEFSTGTIKGRYNSEKKRMVLDMDLPHFIYTDITVDSLTLDASSDRAKIDYALAIKKVHSKDFDIFQPKVRGHVANDTLVSILEVSDTTGAVSYHIGTTLYEVDSIYRLHLIPDGLTLDGNPWSVTPDNYIHLAQPLTAHNLVLSNQGQKLALNSPEGQTNPPLNIDFTDFMLKTFAHMVHFDEDLVNGTLNGNVALQDKNGGLGFTSDVTLTNLKFTGEPIGDLAIKAESVGGLTYQLDAHLTGNGNDVRVKGTYDTDTTAKPIDMKVTLSPLMLSSIEPFSAGQLQSTKGRLVGNLSLQGSSDAPDINGSVTFKEAVINPTLLNSPFKLDNQTITFDKKGIGFNDFTLVDSLGRKAQIDGHVLTKDYVDYAFDLKVHTENFLLMNTTSKDNELYYGTLIVRSDITVKGDLNKPIVVAKIKLVEGTELTYAMPVTDPGLIDREGVVVFVDKNKPTNDIMQVTAASDTVRAALKGIDFTSTIQVDRATKLTVIVDQNTGDFLEVQGGGLFSFGIDPSGKMTLSGVYDVKDGMYRLKFYNIVKREFQIKPGSTIAWAGDPFNARLNLTAIYETKASPYELLVQQTGASEEANKYRQKLEFLVELNVDGVLMKPEISFGLDMPEDERGAFSGSVYTAIQQLNQQEAELNKQVFALLVLNSFISSGGSPDGGSGAGGAARRSASKMLSQQLNKLSDQYIKGVDINLELESYDDYQSGSAETRTDLNVDVSKKFLDDRVSVSVGTNFALEGQNTAATDQGSRASGFAGNVIVEYKLTEDGRYRLKVYHENKYDGLNGQIQETGSAIIFTRDYNKLKNLFKKPEEEKGIFGNE